MTQAAEIVTACDQAFLPGLTAMLNSIARHESGRVVNLLDCGICDRDKVDLSGRFSNLRILTVQPPADLPAPSVGSHATYARLLIGDLFREHDRILYLDADVILMSALQPLDGLELDPAQIVAACLEPYTPTFRSANGIANFGSLGFLGDEPYFNAGVLLVDVARWNRAGVRQKALDYLRQDGRRISLYDQEALNVVLAERWHRLDPEWNVSRYWMHETRRTERPDILRDARIVHFLSSDKPWLSPNAVHPWLLERFGEYVGTPSADSTPTLGAVAVS